MPGADYSPLYDVSYEKLMEYRRTRFHSETVFKAILPINTIYTKREVSDKTF